MKLPKSLLVLLLASNSLFSQKTWYVNHASTANFPTGESWDFALPDLHDALNNAQSGDEIWVAQGVYKPTDGNDRSVHFVMADGVGLYGGFLGSETTLDARDWEMHATILSGEIGNLGDSTDNSYTLLYAYNTMDQTRIDGFILENGNAYNPDISINGDSPVQCGGAIYVNGYAFNGSQLGIYNCTFRHNRARYQGGAVFANGKDGGVAMLHIDHCVFEQNISGAYGGAVSLENSSEQPEPLRISHCAFRANWSGTEGGAIWLKNQQAIYLEDCLFQWNNTQMGNVYIGGKSATYPIVVNRCNFYENSTQFFSQGCCINCNFDYPAAAGRMVQISRSRFWKNEGCAIFFRGTVLEPVKITFEQCVFWKNLKKAGIYSVFGWSISPTNSSAEFTNCLFYKNEGYEFNGAGGGLPYIKLTNCSLVDEGGQSNSWIIPFTTSHSKIILNNCIVSQSSCQDFSNISDSLTCTNVQFATDPLFINPDAGPNADFRLQPCSPAINAGFNAILDSLGINIDLEGNTRIQHGVVDIGPYETALFLAPDVVTLPTCAGSSDGAFELSGNICPPYSITWTNGMETGEILTNLSAGNYALTITDAHGLTIETQVSLPDPDSLLLEAEVGHVTCPDGHTGYVQLSPQGGTAPYQFAPNNPATSNLGAGTYSYTVTDANACSTAQTVTVEAPPPFEFFYTVQNAGPFGATGAILFDSITGGWNGIPTPDDLTNLAAGTYGITLTDDFGCTAVVNIPVGITSSTEEQTPALACRLYPNPGFSDAPFFIETAEPNGFKVLVFDVWGRMVQEQVSPQNKGTLLLNGVPPGTYRMEIIGESGLRAVRRCVVLGR